MVGWDFTFYSMFSNKNLWLAYSYQADSIFTCMDFEASKIKLVRRKISCLHNLLPIPLYCVGSSRQHGNVRRQFNLSGLPWVL